MFDQVSDDVQAFFAEFERAGNTLDAEATSRQFADTFMSADPAQAIPVPKAAFLAALPNREKMFASIGVTGMRLSAISQTSLDDNYVLVDTEWTCTMTSREAEPLTLASAFILHRGENGTFQIVFYLNHQDITTIIRNRAQATAQSPS